MARRFPPTDAVRKIRSRIDHPIVDGDGHLIEFVPLVLDIAAEVAGPGTAERLRAFLAGATDPRASRFAPARVFWGLPEENTLDQFAHGRIADRGKRYLEMAAALKAAPADPDPRAVDDFADSGIEGRWRRSSRSSRGASTSAASATIH